MKLQPNELKFWERFRASSPDDPTLENATVLADYAGHAQMTDRLLALYFSGKKTAGSSLEAAYASSEFP